MNPILHVEIPASDLDRAITFYQRWLQVAVDEPVVLHDCRMAYLPFSDETPVPALRWCSARTTGLPNRGARLHRRR